MIKVHSFSRFEIYTVIKIVVTIINIYSSILTETLQPWVNIFSVSDASHLLATS